MKTAFRASELKRQQRKNLSPQAERILSDFKITPERCCLICDLLKTFFAHVKKVLSLLPLISSIIKFFMATSRPQTILGVRQSNYAGVVNLANLVIASLTGNASFLTPIPSLLSLQAYTTAVSSAIAVWGPVGNRGSHADLLDLRTKVATLYSALLAEAQYVQNTAQLAAGNDYPAMAAIIGTSGFGVKNNPNPQGLLGVPTDFRQIFANNINPYFVKMDWRKPVGLNSPGNVKSYQIMRSITDDFSTALVIGTSTKTTFTDVTAAHATAYFYWVRGVNTDGVGAQTASIAVNTPV